MITCYYCRIYPGLKKDLNNIANCNSRQINKDSDICQNFNPGIYFYCQKNCQRLNIEVCSGRRQKKKSGCDYCSQGDDIELILSNYRRRKIIPPKRPIIRRLQKLIIPPKRPIILKKKGPPKI